MSTARRKGTAAETAVARWLTAHGHPYAERRALRGTRDAGDIAGIPGVCIEVKAAKALDLAGWLAELEVEVIHADAEHGVVVIKRRGRPDPGDWYAVTTLAAHNALLLEAGRA